MGRPRIIDGKRYCPKGHEFTPENTYIRSHRGKLENRCKTCVLEYTAKADWYNSTPEGHAKLLAKKKRWHYRSRYGITIEQRDAMLASQGGRCAICRTSEPQGFGQSFNNGWVVDHDHLRKDKHARSILCSSCNLILGKVEIVGLQKFIDYLVKYK